ncbi:MAG: TetR/AcrR family transcriptional regulator [Sneathiella sp.]|uniref:TetR/AcrR family transcriptional regulator n=1 Tax=Sneathiella sp. TaxID=1964365 RepID=UPI0030017CD2
MARVTAEKVQATRAGLLKAANDVLQAQGYAGLSTRGVAAVAGVPMSQIQYHFGSKGGMVLALFEHLNTQLLERQNNLFNNTDLALSEKWDKACDYLEEDMASGYVRVLHELMVAGLSNSDFGTVALEGLMRWNALLNQLAQTAHDTYGSFGPFTPEDIASLVASAFIGAEALLLLGVEDHGVPIRRSLRRFGEMIRLGELKKI